MKILFMILMIILTGTEYQDKSSMEKSSGFSVEIRNDSEPGAIKEVFVDMASLDDLPKDTVSIQDSEGKPERVWIGVNLCLLLEKKLNISCPKILKISISAPDGYVSVISGELLSALETGICAVALKGETKWPPKYGYMRLLFPQLRAMYWVNSPSKMIIELGEERQISEKYEFYFMDSENLKSIIKKDLKGNPYIAIDDILTNIKASRHSFRILTQDSLFREYADNSINRRLVLQQQPNAAWKLTGIAVPLGLKTRNIFLLTTLNKVLFLKSLSEPENDIFYTSYFQSISKNLPDNANVAIEIVTRDSRRMPAEPIQLTIENMQNLYLAIERQRKNYKDIDHVLLTIGSN